MSDCREYQELISRMLDEDLSETELARLHAHAAACPECRRALDAFAMLRDAIAEDVQEPPALLSEAVMQQVRRESMSAAKTRRAPVGRWIALAACLAIVVFSAYRFDLFSGRKGTAFNQESAFDARSDSVVSQQQIASVSLHAEEPGGAPMTYGVAEAESEPDAATDEAVKSAEDSPVLALPAATAAPDFRDSTVEAEAQASLEYEGERWLLVDYAESLPESFASAVPTANAAQTVHAEAEELDLTLIEGRLYLRLRENLWAVYER